MELKRKIKELEAHQRFLDKKLKSIEDMIIYKSDDENVQVWDRETHYEVRFYGGVDFKHDSSYEKNEDGKLIAIARAKYVHKRKTRNGKYSCIS